MKTPSAPPASSPTIYSQLRHSVTDEGVDLSEDSISFRSRRIIELQEQLELEKRTRAALYKKYRRAMAVLDGADTACLVAGMAAGASGVGLLSTIIAAPVVLALEAGALGCGLVSVGCKFAGQRLHTKARKHWATIMISLSTVKGSVKFK